MPKCDAAGIRRYVELQCELVEEFSKRYPESKDFKWLLDFPKSGTVALGGSEWNFIKHGAGLRFVRNEAGSNIIVDIHGNFAEPRCVDSWRLHQYFLSCGIDTSNKHLDCLIQKMCADGELFSLGNDAYIYKR